MVAVAYDNILFSKTCVFKILFHVLECRDGDQCRPLTFTKTHGCYSTHCQENNITGEVSFAVTEAGSYFSMLNNQDLFKEPFEKKFIVKYVNYIS